MIQDDIETPRRVIKRARTLGQAVKNRIELDDRALARIIGFIENDFAEPGALTTLPHQARPSLPYYETDPLPEGARPTAYRVNILQTYEEAVEIIPEFRRVFECLCEIHKRRVKFAKIRAEQTLPDVADLSHRGFLEVGSQDLVALSTYLRLRKLLYDQDNRAGQESAYLFMKIITKILNGRGFTGRNSPIRHYSSDFRRRAVDCIVDRDAYDFRARMTEAPSRRARFQDELMFPRDCNISGYRPILLAFHQLPGERSESLVEAYLRYGGCVYIGDAAWDHLRSKTGPVMTTFIDQYLLGRLQSIGRTEPQDPDMTIRIKKGKIYTTLG